MSEDGGTIWKSGLSQEVVGWVEKEILAPVSVPGWGGLLPAEERTLLVSIGSLVAGQLDDGGQGEYFDFSRTH